MIFQCCFQLLIVARGSVSASMFCGGHNFSSCITAVLILTTVLKEYQNPVGMLFFFFFKKNPSLLQYTASEGLWQRSETLSFFFTQKTMSFLTVASMKNKLPHEKEASVLNNASDPLNASTKSFLCQSEWAGDSSAFV